MAVKLPNPKYVTKKYKAASYPGQKVQIDVKYVPASCLVGAAVEDTKENGGYYYQYTFIDEYSRFRYLEAFKEHNSYSSSEFIKHCVKRFPYAIECVQTDNGPEFTNGLLSPFRMVCRDFILTESANRVFFFIQICATCSTLSLYWRISITGNY